MFNTVCPQQEVPASESWPWSFWCGGWDRSNAEAELPYQSIGLKKHIIRTRQIGLFSSGRGIHANGLNTFLLYTCVVLWQLFWIDIEAGHLLNIGSCPKALLKLRMLFPPLFGVSSIFCLFSSAAFVFLFSLFWLFVQPDSLQSLKLLPSLNSRPPLVQRTLGCSTTGLFVHFGNDACKPALTCLVVFFLSTMWMLSCVCKCMCERDRKKKYVCVSGFFHLRG